MPETTPRLVKVDGVLTEGDAEIAREAIRQMDADPHGLKAGLVVQSYREHGQEKWVFRCWGTDTCDGWLSLDHGSQQSAERARDRHVAEAHQAAIETPYGPVTAVAEWLRANDIDPDDVPIGGPISIEHGRIEYAALLRNDAGHRYQDPSTGDAAREMRTAPLKVAPPENVQVRVWI